MTILLIMFRRLFSVCVLILDSVLNVKALVDAFNQEKAQVGTFSVIVNYSWKEPLFKSLIRTTLSIASIQRG